MDTSISGCIPRYPRYPHVPFPYAKSRVSLPLPIAIDLPRPCVTTYAYECLYSIVECLFTKDPPIYPQGLSILSLRKQYVQQGAGGRGEPRTHDIVLTAAVIGLTPKRALSTQPHLSAFLLYPGHAVKGSAVSNTAMTYISVPSTTVLQPYQSAPLPQIPHKSAFPIHR